MDKYRSNVSSIMHRISFIGLAVISLTGFFFLTKSAEMQSSFVSSDSVSPSFPRHYFTPANRSFNNLNSNQTGNNFKVSGVCQGGQCVKNGKIAFVLNAKIFTINLDDTGQMNITNNAATDSEPDYFRDVTNIIFSTNRDGNNEIYKMNADGSNQIRLTNDTANQSSPAFSPDGQKIIFVMFSSSSTKVYIMNADGTNLQQFPAPDGFAHEQLTYSPDGTKVAYTTCYNIASAYFRLKQNDKEFEFLNKAIDEGFKNRNALETDMDLTPLRADARFQQVLTRLSSTTRS